MKQETIALLREFYPPEMHLDYQTVSFIPATWADILAVLEAAQRLAALSAKVYALDPVLEWDENEGLFDELNQSHDALLALFEEEI